MGAVEVLTQIRSTTDEKVAVDERDGAIVYLEGMTLQNLKRVLKRCPETIWLNIVEGYTHFPEGGSGRSLPGSGRSLPESYRSLSGTIEVKNSGLKPSVVKKVG